MKIIRTRRLPFWVLLPCAATIAVAAESTPLTWETCLEQAARNSPSIDAAGAQLDASEAGVHVARSALYPQVSVGAASDYSHHDSTSGDTDPALSTSASIEQSLYTGGRTLAEIHSANAAHDQAEAAATSTRADLTSNLRTAFVNLLYAQELVLLLDDIARRRQDNMELVDLRYEGGREHKGSLAASQASLFDAQQQLVQARRLVDVNRQLLCRIMGTPDIASGLIVTGRLVSATSPTLSDFVLLARQTPSYAALLAEQAAAEAQLDSARGARLPTLGLSGSADRTGIGSSTEEDGWSVRLKLSLPLWSGGKTRYTILEAAARVKAAKASAAESFNSLVRNLLEAHQNLVNAIENVVIQMKYLDAADIRSGIARQQYEDGLLSFDNWDLIEDDLITKRKRLLDAQRASLTAEASWWKATGRDAFAASRSEKE